MILYSHTITPRLQYITDFIGKEIIGKKIDLTNDKESFKRETIPKINYSEEKISDNEFFLNPHPILFGKNIQPQQTDCFEVNGNKAFFRTEGDFPFDIFAASFYLLSRYEEYLPHEKDMYGRYAHENSLAFKEKFLQLPLINIWLKDFKKILKNKFPLLAIQCPPFTFLPTYDIDEAYSYKYKGWWRTCGGVANALLKGRWSKISERIKVLREKKEDPYYSYLYIDKINSLLPIRPRYFILSSTRTGKYDRNILPGHREWKSVVWLVMSRNSIGLHPSWQSGDDPSLIKKEKEILEKASGMNINCSRQHFIRFALPQTFRYLIDAGIEHDYSMGYGSINGFRASVASSFYWYDLEKEQQTNLLLHPFCYMEANSFFEQKFSPQQALEEMRHYRDLIKTVNGTMISIWHNTFLGTDKLFEGWNEIYEQFISETADYIPSASG